jgi:adenylosuccinate synthase
MPELKDDTGEKLRQCSEFGATTSVIAAAGLMGWQPNSVAINGYTGMAVTRLDILEFPQIENLYRI